MGAGHSHGLPAGSDRSAGQRHRKRLMVVLGITGGVLAVEVVGGLLSGSLALLADAGHMFTDVAGISFALLALRFAARPATPARTFGYYRLEILAAVVNAVLLFGVSILVLVEAARRLASPPVIASGLMLTVGVIGLLANGVSLWVLRRAQAESLNMRGAYLEVLGDLLGSAAVIVAAVLITVAGWTWADPVASVLIGLLILPRAWSLLREAVDVLLEAAPKGVDLEEVRTHMLDLPGVLDVHDLHAWTITSGLPVLSAHIVVEDHRLADGGLMLDQLGGCLAGHFDVEHCTFQLEPSSHQEHEGSLHT